MTPSLNRTEVRTRRAVPDLLADLLAGPALPGARCAGLAPEHDVDPLPGETHDQHAARLTRAAARCADCPASTTCAQIAAELPERFRVGIWAGRAHGLPHVRRGAA
ncbi:hypothetical protein GCM10010472_52160 [Pseudonocardia halophobica]|uniref:4Fe-4S Wbl-type domain-containing protein n=1 Tax=Pseudonocardia halophobica TaxID=29401 RepID=A0A9W6NWD4_9PSEU|nr:WhiB family transcriptional regulator [Pseudonocardia halophobica]GLL11352.1 hypothetical protein GCM10017577_24930 [Pseudonocardia halophobica]